MAHSTQKQLALRSAYINEQLDLKTAARENNVSYGTARMWKKKAYDNRDDWDSARNAMLIAQGGKKELVNQVVERFCSSGRSSARVPPGFMILSGSKCCLSARKT